MLERRHIEDHFPVKEVGEASAKEKNIRRGHISTLHIWWARRPLAASRATTYAALTPTPKDAEEWQRKRDFIIELSKWENSNNHQLINKARRDILIANGGTSPKVLDPFAGGGSYPLEALRLGCETYSNDYNPVAVLIEKATFEYPQLFGKPFQGMPSQFEMNSYHKNGLIEKGEIQLDLLEPSKNEKVFKNINPLFEAVKYWSDWVHDETQKELITYYPSSSDSTRTVGYIWARTLPCQNPSCQCEIPLVKSFWLSKKNKKRIAMLPIKKDGYVDFSIVCDEINNFPNDYDPDKGTISRAVVNCPNCGGIIDEETTRKLFRDGKSRERMLIVVEVENKSKTKKYRLPTERDLKIIGEIKNKYQASRDELFSDWGFEPIPDETLPLMSGVFNTPLYGLDTWGKLFNVRQSYAIIQFIKNIRRAYHLMVKDCSNLEFSKAVSTYLALILSRHSSYNSSLCWWEPTGERGFNVFGRQALPMVFDYTEQNPFESFTGNWKSQSEITLEIIEQLCELSSDNPVKVTQLSATQLTYPSSFFDAVLTDPPYYNSVPYADLSDFFYVWLNRTIGFLHPELFSTPLSPKDKEITEMAGWDSKRYSYKDKAFFEDNLKRSFQEIHRVLKPNGISVIVYAHKSTEGWETVINALLDSGLVVTGAWPLRTEMVTRLHANDAATLASSIYIVVRKVERKPTGFFNDIKTELHNYLNSKLHRLWEEGIGGADFFIAAIGSAIEIFGKYQQVIDFEGNPVRADRLLQEVRTIATDYAVRQILHNGFATEISDLSRFYVLWRWNYSEAIVPFDEARKLGQSCGIDISLEWGRNGVVKKEKEFVRILGPQNRKMEDLEDPRDLIDVLHKALLLWEKGNKSELIKTLSEKGYGKSEAFYRVAQAISETLPLESKEKKLLDGFLAGKERYQSEVEKIETQGQLF